MGFPITCAEKRAINMSPTFRLLGKATTQTTARSRVRAAILAVRYLRDSI
jgi:hypothetical protein